MSRYHLSEAYAEIYTPRLQEDFDDNLRFIDYMLDEDIEQVVESLFWEFRDYGHTIEESIDLLRVSASDEVICEYIEYLTEANPYAPAGSKESQQYNKFASKSKKRAERDASAQTRRAARKARVDGAISRVRAAWEGAKGGFGRAAKAVSSGVSKAGEFVSKQREAGKAKLQKLIRTGANAVKTGVTRAKNAYGAAKRELSGAPEREARLKSDFNKNVRAAKARASVGNAFADKPESKKPASRPALPAAKTQQQNPRRAAALAKIKAAAEGAKSKGVAFSGPGGTSIAQTAKGKQQVAMRAASGQKRSARRTKVNESFVDYDLILDEMINDLIAEGYAETENDAMDIINSLNENVLYDITQEYLVD